MTKVIDFYAHVEYVSLAQPQTISVSYKPIDKIFFYLYEHFLSGLVVDANTTDELNSVFTSEEEAVNFCYTDEVYFSQIATMLSNMSSYYGETCVRGNLVFNNYEVFTALNNTQPLSETLTDLSGITISGDVLAMMGAADLSGAAMAFAAPISDALALDTMAFESVGNYYMKSTIDSNFAPISHTHTASQISDSTTTGRALMTASNQAAARSAIGAGTSTFSGAYGDLTGVPSTFTPSSHTHVANDISNATTLGKTILTAANAASVRSAIMSTQTHINDAATNAATDAATNAPNNAPTNLNVVTTLLGTLTGEVNATNQRQNQIADVVNANATKQNAGFTILNTLAGKFNLSLDILEANGLMSA